ncbi:ComEC/Rec2 family competence protein [Gordonia sp. ABSL1-1]|uniref:ComEC/Rec2 family competence protein n=1 Tax=Gordonia sp. ABSL1-1 TaxID=3053923 RepID=UPI002573ED63|nr:ComEC/Rec2 family competence protein [Gordonia sp. ABSL1-1]MDL9935548.1 ComEC/Rec2 family competence protein [Gordonia sp. ABSL1-1]
MDLRLLIPALAVWATSIVGLLAPVAVTVGVAAGGLSVGAVAVWCVARGRVSWRGVGIVIVGAGLTATCATALALRQEMRADHPLAHMSGKVTVTVVVTDDPVVVGAQRFGRVRTRVAVEMVGPRAVRAADAELVADEQSWSGLLPGQRVRTLVRVRPPPRGTLLVASLTASGTPTLIGQPPGYQRVAGLIRDRLQVNSSRALGAESAGLLPGLVLGDVRGLDPDTKADFRAAGLTHLCAVSGSNFAIICGAVLLAVRSAGASPRVAAILGMLTIVGFVILVRPSPSVIRAALMGAVGLLALVSARRAQAFPALGAAVVAGLLWWPELALQPGFALSVAATCGLVLWAGTLAEWLRARRIPVGVAEVAAMAVAAQVVTAPIVAMVAGTFSVVGIVANLLVAPVVAVISVVGTLAALIGVLGPPDGVGAAIAELLLRSLGPELWWMTGVARVLAGPGWATVEVPDGVVGAMVVSAAMVVIIVAARFVVGRVRR